jgi:hypothetical protein
MPTAFQKRLATIAQTQYDKFRFIRENQEPLASQIEAYWTGLGFKFPGVEVAWSAVFVSWCVKQAGATNAQFTFAPMHSTFMRAAIKNAQAGVGVFRGHDLNEYAPKVGDILQNNRAGNSYDFAYAASHGSYKSHSAIVMEVGVDNKGNYLRTIGGNEENSVGMKEARLDSKGFVKNGDGHYIGVIETLL